MSAKKNIVVSGANGQLGKSFQKIAFDWQEYDFHFYDRESLDITSKHSIESVFQDVRPDVFINCAAYTAVDKAETEREKAYEINAEALDFITSTCIKHDTLLIHFSSDYVYHNNLNIPMDEDSATLPKSIYAQSKKTGEEVIAQSPVNAIVLRTSWVYSEFGNNFVKTMLKLGKDRSILNVVDDQIGCPTYAPDLANASVQLIRQELAEPSLGCQVFNYAGEGQISWYDFALYIFELAEIKIDVHPIPSEEYPTPAIRPSWSVMNLSKIKTKYGITPRPWKESLKECIYLLS